MNLREMKELQDRLNAVCPSPFKKHLEHQEGLKMEDRPNILATHTRFLPFVPPSFLMPGIGLNVVLVAGEIGDYAAYAGVGDPESVARYGDKIPFGEAKIYFPGIEEKRYRR